MDCLGWQGHRTDDGTCAEVSKAPSEVPGFLVLGPVRLAARTLSPGRILQGPLTLSSIQLQREQAEDEERVREQ